MSNLIKQHYKVILGILLLILLLPIIPTYLEIVFKLGNILGTYIRILGC